MNAPTIADELGGNWHKVVGALLAKYGDQRLGVAEIACLDGLAVVVSHADDGHTLVLRLLPQAEADRLAEEFQRTARRRN